jgi:peptide/nickel transport system substrate-binding protein
MRLYKRIAIIALVLLTTAAFVFASGTQDTSSSSSGSTAMSGAKESPMLAEMVASGEILPLEERLPENPLVVQVVDSIGKYGGTMRRTYLGPSDGGITRLMADGLFRFSIDGTEIHPNLATGYDLSADGRVYTIHLRKGVKWSDGDLFDADDMMFWYEDVALNEELNAAPPKLIVSGGDAGLFEKVDQYTVRITFKEPYAFFIRTIATPEVSTNGFYPFYPEHYLKQFHPKYAGEAAVNKLVEDAGVESWMALFSDMSSTFFNPERPVIRPWMVTNSSDSQRQIAVRNPYYWKVDAEGNQLPYIDRLVFDLVENTELVLLKASNGELDFQFRHIKFQDFTLLKENESRGDYTVYTHAGDRASDVCLWPNMSVQDEKMNMLMNSMEFKMALSYAIDRDEINELMYFGLGTPRAITAIRSEPTFIQANADKYIKYDPATASKLLDELGFDKKNSEGMRLWPDGETLFLNLTTATAWPQMASVGEFLVDYFRDIGIDSMVNNLERSVFYEKSYNNELAIPIFTSPGTSLGNNWWMFPMYHNSNGYGQWYRSSGKEGVEPPVGSNVRNAMELYDSAMSSASMDTVYENIKQILTWGAEELWGIGIVGEIPAIAIVSNKLKNVPKNAPSGTHLGHPGNLYTEQFYFDE